MTFEVTPKRIPAGGIIANVEAEIRRLPPAQTDEIRREAVMALRSAKQQKSNLSAEIQALRDWLVGFVAWPCNSEL